MRKDRHVPGTSGLSIRSFTAGVAGDTSASAPIFACVWPFSAGAASEAISPDAPDGCGSRTPSPEVHRPALGNPGATPALSPTEARARSRRLARGFLTPDPIKRRATKGSGDAQTRRRARAWPDRIPNSAVCMERSRTFGTIFFGRQLEFLHTISADRPTWPMPVFRCRLRSLRNRRDVPLGERNARLYKKNTRKHLLVRHTTLGSAHVRHLPHSSSR